MTKIPICILCKEEADDEHGLMCHTCKEGDGVIMVSKEDWDDDSLTFDEIILKRWQLNE
jgi:hypothetical protein